MFTSTAWDCNCEAFHVCFVALASFWYLNCRLHGALHVSKAPSESFFFRTSDLFRLSRSMVRADPQSLRGALSGERSLPRTGLDTRPLPRRRVPQLKQVFIFRSFFFLSFVAWFVDGTDLSEDFWVSPLFVVFVSCRFRVHGSFADISYDVVIGGAQPNTTVGFKSCLESWSIAFIPL